MYVKIPSEIRAPLLKELRRYRLRASILYFPVIVLVFSGIAALAVLVKGHALLDLLHEFFWPESSETSFILAALGVTAMLTTIVMVFFLWQHNRDCDYQTCLYCAKCDVVDRFDDGICPVCMSPLNESAFFYFTSDKDEKKIIARWGLESSRVEQITAASKTVPPKIGSRETSD